MAKQLEAILTDGKSRTIQVPAEIDLDDFYEVHQWTQQKAQEWLPSGEGNAVVRRDAIIEFRVVEPTEPTEPFATAV
jgi:hypothetical protein